MAKGSRYMRYSVSHLKRLKGRCGTVITSPDRPLFVYTLYEPEGQVTKNLSLKKDEVVGLLIRNDTIYGVATQAGAVIQAQVRGVVPGHVPGRPYTRRVRSPSWRQAGRTCVFFAYR